MFKIEHELQVVKEVISETDHNLYERWTKPFSQWEKLG